MKIIATINEVITRNWKVNAGEYKVKKCTVETPEEFAECDAIMVSFNSKENGKFVSRVKNGKCDIPCFTRPGNVSVGVYAYTETEGKLELRYSPTPVVMPVNMGSYIEGEKPPTPTPGTYAELLKEIEDIKNSGGGGSGVDLDILTEVDPGEEHTNEQVYCAKAIDEMVFAFDETIQEIEERKQDTLIGGENIKTINGESLLGSGNISIAGGSGGNTNNKVFERIATVTVVPDENGELPTKISITADDNGNPFELTDVYCDVLIGLTDGLTGRFYVSVGNPSERNMISVIGNATLNINNTQLRKWCFRVDNYGDGRGGLTSAPSVSLMHTADFPSANVSTMYGQPIPVWRTIDIREVQFVGQAGNTQTFMEGTTITLWGVRK